MEIFRRRKPEEKYVPEGNTDARRPYLPKQDDLFRQIVDGEKRINEGHVRQLRNQVVMGLVNCGQYIFDMFVEYVPINQEEAGSKPVDDVSDRPNLKVIQGEQSYRDIYGSGRDKTPPDSA